MNHSCYCVTGKTRVTPCGSVKLSPNQYIRAFPMFFFLFLILKIVSYITTILPQLEDIPPTRLLQGLLWVLLGEGEADRLRRLLKLSQIHPPLLVPQVVTPMSTSTLSTKLQARSSEQMESLAVGSESDGYSSSWGRTRQCREDRQLPGLNPPPPIVAPLPAPSQLSSSEGAERKVVQNIIVAAGLAWKTRRERGRVYRQSEVFFLS